jgi:hypothetical protein
MQRSASNSILNTLLACLLGFVLQLWFPQMLRAADLVGTGEELSWDSTNAEDAGGSGPDHCLCAIGGFSLFAHFWLNDLFISPRPHVGRGGLSLIPLQGVQPSAP